MQGVLCRRHALRAVLGVLLDERRRRLRFGEMPSVQHPMVVHP